MAKYLLGVELPVVPNTAAVDGLGIGDAPEVPPVLYREEFSFMVAVSTVFVRLKLEPPLLEFAELPDE